MSFLIAEDIRQEERGKITFLGAFTGGEIEVTPEPNAVGPLALSGLGVYFGIKGGRGNFRIRVELVDPENANLLPANTQQQLEKPQETVNLDVMFKIAPFPIKFGTYRARVFLDDHMYEKSFVVKQGGAQARATPSVAH